ncbi:MAG: phenylalanine--tRNA ligase subunit alpha [Clostridia bacterium]
MDNLKKNDKKNIKGNSAIQSKKIIVTKTITFHFKSLNELEELGNRLFSVNKSADNNIEPLKKQLENINVMLLGKSGELTTVLKTLKDYAPEQRASIGAEVNNLRKAIENKIKTYREHLACIELQKKLEQEKIDITVPAKNKEVGSLHPVNLVINELTEVCVGLGFEVAEGPEIETDYYNFQALNVPLDHPARDMQDTFFINPQFLLRTQTSPVQVRVMESKKPPIKIISPGTVYRVDNDATHTPMFHQIEGLVVDKNVSMRDLKGMLSLIAQTLFGENTVTRLRPSFFPFTEPSVEVDATCPSCHGKGCGLCKGTGWLEILGAGMVNPKVLENCGIDSKVYSGFAFGLGVERIAMIKFGIPDIRMLFENDIRFLSQF